MSNCACNSCFSQTTGAPLQEYAAEGKVKLGGCAPGGPNSFCKECDDYVA